MLYHALEKENEANITLENENRENFEKETQITTNQNISIITHEPQVVLTRLKRKDYEKYIDNNRQPLAFIENTISSKVSTNYKIDYYLQIFTNHIYNFIFITKFECSRLQEKDTERKHIHVKKINIKIIRFKHKYLQINSNTV